MKKMHYLFLLKQSPYQSNLAREALDFALASAAFDQQVSLVFSEDAVFQLLKQQQSQQGKKSIEKTLASLALFDIEQVFYTENCAKERSLSSSDFSLEAQAINKADLHSLIQQADKVFSF